MDRARFYQLRHDVRASGWKWNGGTQFRIGRTREYTSPLDPPKNKQLSLIMATLPDLYAKPLDRNMEATDSQVQYMRLVYEWKQVKTRVAEGRFEGYTKIWWQNFIRCHVRGDRRIFTEQLTSY